MRQPIFRSLVVLSCFGASAIGLLFSVFALAGLSALSGLLSGATSLLWLSAMLALVRMSFAWIRDVRLGAHYSRVALLRGLSAASVIPLLLAFGLQPHRPYSTLQLALDVGAIEIALVFPIIALAVYLNHYHAT